MTEEQRKQLAVLCELHIGWSSKINVISRKNIENLCEHHVPHSLGIARATHFHLGSRVMDLGTGGGFPGIPLTILSPDIRFHLVNSTGKKVRIATEMASAAGLRSVTFRHTRAEEGKQAPDFVVNRAVISLADLIKIVRRSISSKQQNALPNGLICLKGGELKYETIPLEHKTTIHNLSEDLDEEFFQTKKVVHVMV